MKLRTKLILLGLCAILLLIIANRSKVVAYLEKTSNDIKNDKIYRKYQDSIVSFTFQSFRCSGVLQFKLNKEKKNISYNCYVNADSGFVFSNIEGSIVIQLLDKNAFIIDKFVPDYTTKIGIRDNNDNLIGILMRDEIEIPLDNFVKIKQVSAPNSFRITKIIESQPVTKKGTIKKKEKQTNTDDFDQEMEMWTQRASRIKIGMTYQEMLQVAGEPRVKAQTTTQEWLDGYGYEKYNYGYKWVLFKDKLVAKIK